MAERMLIALDDSEPARAALSEALTRFAAADLFALHVLDTSEASHGVESGAADGWLEAKRAEARALLDEAVATASEHDVELETAIEIGPAGRTIVEYARDNDVDHVVIGSHGRSGISRILVGSVAEHVIRNAPTSVTVARASD